MSATFAFVLVLIGFALIFDYINGFHDAANSIATVVSTRVLSPGVAVLWAAFFNFVAFAVFGTRVAKAIGDGVRMDLIAPEWRLYVLLGALIGAIIYPEFRVSIRGVLEEMELPAAMGAFELKEHFAVE